MSRDRSRVESTKVESQKRNTEQRRTMVGAFVLSLALLGLAGALIDSHRRTWRQARENAELSQRASKFALAQYRRRMQASGMIGVIGVLIGVWPIVPREPAPMAFYLAMLLAGWAWIMLLALLDILATQRHYRRIRREQHAAHLQLALEMQAARDAAQADH